MRPKQANTLAIWRIEYATILGAVAWAVEHPDHHDDDAAAAEIVVLLSSHWIAGGQLADGRRWLDRVLGLDDVAVPLRAHALACAAWVSLLQGDRLAAAPYLREAEALRPVVDDPRFRAAVDTWTALLRLLSGQNEPAIERYQRAIRLFESCGDTGAALLARFQGAMAQTYSRDHAGALATCRLGIELSEEHGELWNRAYSLWMSSLCLWRLSRISEAEQVGCGALEIQRAFADGICIALQLQVLSWVAHRRRQERRAQRLAALAETAWGLIGTSVAAFGPDLSAENAVSTPVVEPAARLGLPTTKAAVVHEALDVLEQPAAHGDRAGDVPALTRREAEILPMLVRDASNRAIADDLTISIRTVEGHVANILDKAGVATRAEIAAWHAGRLADTRVVQSGSSTGDRVTP